MLNLAICDDNPIIIEQLESYLDEISDIDLNYEVFFSAEELYNYNETMQLKFDIYILDIKMESGKLSGLQLAKKIRKGSSHSLIIFLTGYSEYVYKAFEVITFDYILKPASFDAFNNTLHRACSYLRITKTIFSFRYQKNNYSIPCGLITYIEKSGRKAFIHTSYGKIYQCNMKVCDIWQQLDTHMFASIRISCIVNLSEIMEIVRDELLLKDGSTLYIGREYQRNIKLRHLQFLKEEL